MEIFNRLQNQYRDSVPIEIEIVSVKENERVCFGLNVCNVHLDVSLYSQSGCGGTWPPV